MHASAPRKPIYSILSPSNDDGPMIPIGALWERPDGHGFSGNIDFTPLNTRIAVLPAQKEQRISTVAMRTDKAPVLLLFGAANKKSPLVNIGALWHTKDKKGYQGALYAVPRNGKVLVLLNNKVNQEQSAAEDIDWSDESPF